MCRDYSERPAEKRSTTTVAMNLQVKLWMFVWLKRSPPIDALSVFRQSLLFLYLWIFFGRCDGDRSQWTAILSVVGARCAFRQTRRESFSAPPKGGEPPGSSRVQWSRKNVYDVVSCPGDTCDTQANEMHVHYFLFCTHKRNILCTQGVSPTEHLTSVGSLRHRVFIISSSGYVVCCLLRTGCLCYEVIHRGSKTPAPQNLRSQFAP